MDPNLTLDPKARGDEFLRAHDYDAAILAYREAIKQQPTGAYAYRMIANCYLAMQGYADAVEWAEKGASLQPTDPEARYALGYALGASGRYLEGIRELDATIELSPTHIAAKQALVYCLTQVGNQLAQTDLKDAEPYFDRAHKLEQNNPHHFATLLDLYMRSGQRGKAIKIYQDVSEAVRGSKDAEAVVKRFESDPEYKAAVRQTSFGSPPSTSVSPKPTATQPQQIPCPGCGLPIMSFAAVCPHCRRKLKAYGSFADIDRGPAVEWQEVAFTITAILWTLWNGAGVVTGLMQKNETARMFYTTINVLFCLVGVGMVFRWQTPMFIGRIIVWLGIIYAAWMVLVSAMVGVWIIAAIFAGFFLVSAFMAYLFSYVSE